jgi:hypothetical protein
MGSSPANLKLTFHLDHSAGADHSECNGLLLIGNRRHENAQQAGPACPAIDLEKNWRRKEEQLAYSVQVIDLIGAP